MIEIFAKLKELTAKVAAIRSSDMDKGQIDRFNIRPSIPFPSVLFRINITRTDDIGGGIQRCYCSCNVRLVFDYFGETASYTPDSALSDSLEYLNITKDVYTAIHYKGDNKIGKFLRRAQTQEIRADGLTVMNIPFETTFMDKSAAVD